LAVKEGDRIWYCRNEGIIGLARKILRKEITRIDFGDEMLYPEYSSIKILEDEQL
jgi:hypothetical protein